MLRVKYACVYNYYIKPKNMVYSYRTNAKNACTRLSDRIASGEEGGGKGLAAAASPPSAGALLSVGGGGGE